jgi:F0F1-type ATP synthase assembly protein I
MKVAVVFVGIAVAALGFSVALVTALNPNPAGSSVFLTAGPIVVLSAAAVAFLTKRSREKRNLTASSEGIERELARTAQSRVMIDGTIVGLALGLLLLVLKASPASIGVFSLVVFMLLDFYVRFLILLRRAKRQ